MNEPTFHAEVVNFASTFSVIVIIIGIAAYLFVMGEVMRAKR